MKHANDVSLAGPISNARVKMFETWGLLTANIAAVRVKVSLDSKDAQWAQGVCDSARSAVVHSGYFDSRRGNDGRWWYDVGCRKSCLSTPDGDVPLLNRARVVGAVRDVQGPWLVVGCSYRIPGNAAKGRKSEWRDRVVHVLAQGDGEIYRGREIVAVGAARPKVDGTWQLHLEASGIWTL